MTLFETIDQRIDRLTEERRKEEEIVCPECETKQDTSELFDLCTYWGEGSPVLQYCQYCDAKFYVQEHVRRTYTVIPKEEEELCLSTTS